VLSGDRSEYFFTPQKYPYPSFLHVACVAVRAGGKVKYANPGTPYLPYGSLVWFEENTTAMIISEEGYAWQTTPLTNHQKSTANRTGKLNLSEDGTLEGSIRFEYNGHQATSRRREGYFDSPSKREEDFKDELKQKISSIEISNLMIENFDDSSKPLIYSMNIKAPNYAEKTGKRLFLQPGFFEYGSNPAFSSATRVHDINFPYPWGEQDELMIQLPKSFELDNADQPGDVSDPSKIGFLSTSIGINKATNVLLYKRNFYFGGNGKILFPVSVYQPLKNLFDAFHNADTHKLSLKQK
jgi:hypothetical protein